MTEINKPMDIPEFNLQPPITGKMKLSEDMQQTLSLLCAYVNNKRVTLKASETGVLNVAEPRIKDIAHYTQAGAVYEYVGSNIPITECMVIAHPDNAGTVWIRPDKIATVDNAWPLAAWDIVKFTFDNLNQLNMLFVEDGDAAIVAYTR